MNFIYHHNLDPVIFQLGPLQPRWYALMYLIGFIIAYFLMSRNPKAKELGLSSDDVMDLLTYGFFGVILGGRLGYVFFYGWYTNPTTGQFVNRYFENPLQIVAFWQGGMAFHGALIGSILAAFFYAHKKKISVLSIFDMAAIAVALGLMFGRFGNFINGELWGAPTDGTWGVVFANTGGGPEPRHPTQLYEAFTEGLLLFLLLNAVNRFLTRLKPGSIGALFLVFYGFGRSIVEFYRLPDQHIGYLYGGWMTMGHLLCSVMILAGLLMFVFVNRAGAPQTGKLEEKGTVPSPPPETTQALAPENTKD